MVPALTPRTTPDVLTVATVVVLLAQVPPLVAVVRVMTLPIHTPDGPVRSAGAGLTTIVRVVRQPVGSV